MFYTYGIKVNKCIGSWNNINNPYAKWCVSDVVKNKNVKVLYLMSKSNETRHIKWHKIVEEIKKNVDVNVKN